MSSTVPSRLAADPDLALFLDVDGTLLEIAETPDAVVVPPELRQTLAALASRFDGALALVSGRSIHTLDALFAPLRLAAAGIHGCERREADGRILQPQIDKARFAAAREVLLAWTLQHPGTLLEDKEYALALHYRLVPEVEGAALTAVQSVLESLDTHALQRGKSVFEIRPAGYSKGSAIDLFMGQKPFQGRTPVFIGDDVTDEAGFVAVNELGGISIRVGETSESSAQYRFANVAAVLEWLSLLANR